MQEKTQMCEVNRNKPVQMCSMVQGQATVDNWRVDKGNILGRVRLYSEMTIKFIFGDKVTKNSDLIVCHPVVLWPQLMEL